jgi:hypothetical protein
MQQQQAAMVVSAMAGSSPSAAGKGSMPNVVNGGQLSPGNKLPRTPASTPVATTSIASRGSFSFGTTVNRRLTRASIASGNTRNGKGEQQTVAATLGSGMASKDNGAADEHDAAATPTVLLEVAAKLVSLCVATTPSNNGATLAAVAESAEEPAVSCAAQQDQGLAGSSETANRTPTASEAAAAAAIAVASMQDICSIVPAADQLQELAATLADVVTAASASVAADPAAAPQQLAPAADAASPCAPAEPALADVEHSVATLATPPPPLRSLADELAAWQAAGVLAAATPQQTPAASPAAAAPGTVASSAAPGPGDISRVLGTVLGVALEQAQSLIAATEEHSGCLAAVNEPLVPAANPEAGSSKETTRDVVTPKAPVETAEQAAAGLAVEPHLHVPAGAVAESDVLLAPGLEEANSHSSLGRAGTPASAHRIAATSRRASSQKPAGADAAATGTPAKSEQTAADTPSVGMAAATVRGSPKQQQQLEVIHFEQAAVSDMPPVSDLAKLDSTNPDGVPAGEADGPDIAVQAKPLAAMDSDSMVALMATGAGLVERNAAHVAAAQPAAGTASKQVAAAVLVTEPRPRATPEVGKRRSSQAVRVTPEAAAAAAAAEETEQKPVSVQLLMRTPLNTAEEKDGCPEHLTDGVAQAVHVQSGAASDVDIACPAVAAVADPEGPRANLSSAPAAEAKQAVQDDKPAVSSRRVTKPSGTAAGRSKAGQQRRCPAAAGAATAAGEDAAHQGMLAAPAVATPATCPADAALVDLSACESQQTGPHALEVDAAELIVSSVSPHAATAKPSSAEQPAQEGQHQDQEADCAAAAAAANPRKGRTRKAAAAAVPSRPPAARSGRAKGKATATKITKEGGSVDAAAAQLELQIQTSGVSSAATLPTNDQSVDAEEPVVTAANSKACISTSSASAKGRRAKGKAVPAAAGGDATAAGGAQAAGRPAGAGVTAADDMQQQAGANTGRSRRAHHVQFADDCGGELKQCQECPDAHAAAFHEAQAAAARASRAGVRTRRGQGGSKAPFVADDEAADRMRQGEEQESVQQVTAKGRKSSMKNAVAAGASSDSHTEELQQQTQEANKHAGRGRRAAGAVAAQAKDLASTEPPAAAGVTVEGQHAEQESSKHQAVSTARGKQSKRGAATADASCAHEAEVACLQEGPTSAAATSKRRKAKVAAATSADVDHAPATCGSEAAHTDEVNLVTAAPARTTRKRGTAAADAVAPKPTSKRTKRDRTPAAAADTPVEHEPAAPCAATSGRQGGRAEKEDQGVDKVAVIEQTRGRRRPAVRQPAAAEQAEDEQTAPAAAASKGRHGRMAAAAGSTAANLPTAVKATKNKGRSAGQDEQQPEDAAPAPKKARRGAAAEPAAKDVPLAGRGSRRPTAAPAAAEATSATTRRVTRSRG